jgi:hypothetical protein
MYGARRGALVYGAKSAAVAGAAIPKATNPTVPSKNFFIVSIPIVMRAVGAQELQSILGTV